MKLKAAPDAGWKVGGGGEGAHVEVRIGVWSVAAKVIPSCARINNIHICVQGVPTPTLHPELCFIRGSNLT